MSQAQDEAEQAKPRMSQSTNSQAVELTNELSMECAKDVTEQAVADPESIKAQANSDAKAGYVPVVVERQTSGAIARVDTPQREAGRQLGMDHKAMEALDGYAMQTAKIPQQLKGLASMHVEIAARAMGNLRERLGDDSIAPGTLSIISGISSQRAMELSKLTAAAAEPSWQAVDVPE